jgi:hypothetical protein
MGSHQGGKAVQEVPSGHGQVIFGVNRCQLQCQPRCSRIRANQAKRLMETVPG